jgi:hypothetical protein
MVNQGKVGHVSLSEGAEAPLRIDKTGAQVVQQLHGQYYEQASRGNVYRFGMTTTALSANTISLTATTTPIIGLWNPANSGKNLIPIFAVCTTNVAGNSAVAPGGFVWATSTGNSAITTGTNGTNVLTWVAGGGVGKGFNISIALTGLTNNLVVQRGASFGSIIAAQPATATALIAPTGIEYFDGIEIVPPGGVLALLNTVSTTTVSVCSAIYWEEITV